MAILSCHVSIKLPPKISDGQEIPNQLSLSVSFPGATPARRVGSFRRYPFVMIFLARVIDALHADGVSGVGELDVGP